MSTSIEAVKQRLPKNDGEPFTLDTSLLDLPGAATLLAHFPDGQLVLAQTEHASGTLTVTGEATLDGVTTFAGVIFTPDQAGTSVAGVQVSLVSLDSVVRTKPRAYDLRGLPLVRMQLPQLVLVLSGSKPEPDVLVCAGFGDALEPVWFTDMREPGLAFHAREELTVGEVRVHIGARWDPSVGRVAAVVDASSMQAGALVWPAPRPVGVARDPKGKGCDASRQEMAEDASRRVMLLRLEAVSLRDIPLIGPLLPEHVGLEDLFALSSTHDLTGPELCEYLEELAGTAPPPRNQDAPVLPPLPERMRTEGVKAGVSLAVTLRCGEMRVQLTGHEDHGKVEAWVSVDLVAGPLRLKRAGLMFGDSAFYLMVDVALTLDGVTIETQRLGIGLAKDSRPRVVFGGLTLAVDSQRLPFEITTDLSTDTKIVAARWRDEAGIHLSTLSRSVGVPVPDTPLTTVQDLALAYDLASGSLMLAAQTGGLDLVLARLGAGGKPTGSAYVGAVQVDAEVSLRQIPYLGEHINSDDNLVIKRVRACASSARLTAEQTGVLLRLLQDCQSEPASTGPLPRMLPDFPASGLVKGLSFGVDFTLRGTTHQFSSGGLDSVKETFPLEVQLGPLAVHALRLEAQDEQGLLGIDASVRLGDLELEAVNLGVRVPLHKGGRFRGQLEGLVLTIAGKPPLHFTLPSDAQPGTQRLVAQWRAAGDHPGVELTKLTELVGVKAPAGMVPTLRRLDFVYDWPSECLAIGMASETVQLSAVHTAKDRKPAQVS